VPADFTPEQVERAYFGAGLVATTSREGES